MTISATLCSWAILGVPRRKSRGQSSMMAIISSAMRFSLRWVDML